MLQPISLREANAFIATHHRHHRPVVGAKFALAAVVGGGSELAGVVVVGRPVARGWDHTAVAEVTRLCTTGGRNACSFLYGAARRVALAMGYRRVITYILASEPGTSLKASGWRFVRLTDGGSWSCPSRARTDKHPLEPKQLWEAAA